MNINQLMHPGSLKEVYSNGNATTTRATPIVAEFQVNEMPSVVYHGSKDNPLDTGGHVIDKIYKMPQETKEPLNNFPKSAIIQPSLTA
jgi:hypothetical protein